MKWFYAGSDNADKALIEKALIEDKVTPILQALKEHNASFVVFEPEILSQDVLFEDTYIQVYFNESISDDGYSVFLNIEIDGVESSNHINISTSTDATLTSIFTAADDLIEAKLDFKKFAEVFEVEYKENETFEELVVRIIEEN